jgi:hypothetical protein
MTANAAQIASVLRPMFSNSSAENIANAIVNQQAEWRTQVELARRANLTPEALQSLASQSTWYQLMSARSKLQDVMGSVAENFKLLLPSLEAVAASMAKIATFVDPKIGNPAAGLGLLGMGGIAAFLTFRHAIAAMGPLARTLLGGGAGFLLGGPAGLMTGALLMRGMGGGAAAGGGNAANVAAGAAGAAAGASWGRRFLAVAGGILRSLPRLLGWGVATDVALQIIESWETVKNRLIAIFHEIKAAAPTWLLGQGKGMGALGNDPQGLAALPQDIENYRQSWREWLLGTDIGQWMYQHSQYPMLERIRRQRELAGMGIDLNALEEDARLRARVPSGGSRIVNVTGNPISINITMPTGSNAQAVGEAAGNAVGSALRGVLGDVPALP